MASVAFFGQGGFGVCPVCTRGGGVSLGRKAKPRESVELTDINFRTTSAFNVSAVAVALILMGFYVAWW